MHTVGTEVKDKRVVQGEATRTALVLAARTLFGDSGYAATSTEEIVARAGVTKGALYHHFNGKEDIFRAVLEQVQQEVSDQAVVEFLRPDSWRALLDGCGLWIDAHLDPSIRRIVLLEARAVLGWDDVRSIENRYGVVAVRGALRKAMQAGVIERQPLRPLALLLTGALGEACQYVAEADDPVAARAEVGLLIERLLTGFRVLNDAPPSGSSEPPKASSAISEIPDTECQEIT
jgi:AcrR family transcriptional regulator